MREGGRERREREGERQGEREKPAPVIFFKSLCPVRVRRPPRLHTHGPAGRHLHKYSPAARPDPPPRLDKQGRDEGGRPPAGRGRRVDIWREGKGARAAATTALVFLLSLLLYQVQG